MHNRIETWQGRLKWLIGRYSLDTEAIANSTQYSMSTMFGPMYRGDTMDPVLFGKLMNAVFSEPNKTRHGAQFVSERMKIEELFKGRAQPSGKSAADAKKPVVKRTPNTVSSAEASTALREKPGAGSAADYWTRTVTHNAGNGKKYEAAYHVAREEFLALFSNIDEAWQCLKQFGIEEHEIKPNSDHINMRSRVALAELFIDKLKPGTKPEALHSALDEVISAAQLYEAHSRTGIFLGDHPLGGR